MTPIFNKRLCFAMMALMGLCIAGYWVQYRSSMVLALSRAEDRKRSLCLSEVVAFARALDLWVGEDANAASLTTNTTTTLLSEDVTRRCATFYGEYYGDEYSGSEISKARLDPWGNPLRFVFEAKRNDISGGLYHFELRVWSIGPNARDESGRGDDIRIGPVMVVVPNSWVVTP